MSEAESGTGEQTTTEKVHPIIRGSLERLEEQGVLGPDEAIVEQELAGMKRRPGVLLVTNRRVLFFRASAVSKKTSLVSLPLDEVTSVEASERRSPIRKRGVLRIRSAGEAETVVEHIPGGEGRAEELGAAIFRERGRRGGTASESG